MQSDRCYERVLAIGLTLVTILGVVIAYRFFDRSALHSDEYLTLYRSLLISQGDLFLESDPSQKPPLLYLVTGGLFSIFGNHREISLLIGFVSSILLIPATGALAFVLTRSVVAGLVAALCVALSPFQIAFSATAFLDPPMILLGILGLIAAASGHGLRAGILLGASLAVKQQAIFFVLLAPFLLSGARGEQRQTRRHLISFISVITIAIALMLLWSLASTRGALPSFVSGQIHSESNQIDGAIVINPFTEGLGLYWLRLSDWGRFLALFFGPLSLIVIPLCLVAHGFFVKLDARSRSLQFIAAWCVLILLIHTALRFRIVDRYMLVLVPIFSCLIGAMLGKASARTSRGRLPALVVAGLLCLSALLGIRSLNENPRVLPSSPGARPRLVGLFTNGSPLSIPAVEYLKQRYSPSTEIYAHGALFPAVKFEFSEFQQVRSVLWPLRLSREEPNPSPRILLWERGDERRLEKLKGTLSRNGFALDQDVDAELGRLVVFKVVPESAIPRVQ